MLLRVHSIVKDTKHSRMQEVKGSRCLGDATRCEKRLNADTFVMGASMVIE